MKFIRRECAVFLLLFTAALAAWCILKMIINLWN